MREDWGRILASVNATLNGLSGVCLLAGLWAILNKKREIHRRFMTSALIISTLFLVSYLTRFALTGVHRFGGTGLVRTFYLGLLASHTVLAAVTPVLALRTFYLGSKERWESHRRWAHVTFPIWLYVSVTGVVVYGMLYWLK